jgi:hypothetical protein
MSQLVLFAPDAPVAAPAGRHDKYARSSDLIACPVIEAELMAIFRASPADWLDWPAFRSVIDKHGVGFVLGHKLAFMARRGLIEEKEIYLGSGIGAERPGSPNYQGFRIEYRLANFAHEREIVRAA